jgi:hypothetical protein
VSKPFNIIDQVDPSKLWFGAQLMCQKLLDNLEAYQKGASGAEQFAFDAEGLAEFAKTIFFVVESKREKKE